MLLNYILGTINFTLYFTETILFLLFPCIFSKHTATVNAFSNVVENNAFQKVYDFFYN